MSYNILRNVSFYGTKRAFAILGQDNELRTGLLCTDTLKRMFHKPTVP